MESRAAILRGWPADGARERSELITQGALLTNGDMVEMQANGTVNKTSATNTKRAGIVVRGNVDDASTQGGALTLAAQPAKTITAMTWSGGVVTATSAAHGFSTGNIVTIAGVTPAGYNGVYAITVVDANTFTYAVAVTLAVVTVQGTATLSAVNYSSIGNAGKALVLWGNYIVRTQAYAIGAYVPGSPVTVANGVFALANGTTDPEVGYVLSVQAATTGISGTTASLVINVF